MRVSEFAREYKMNVPELIEYAKSQGIDLQDGTSALKRSEKSRLEELLKTRFSTQEEGKQAAPAEGEPTVQKEHKEPRKRPRLNLDAIPSPKEVEEEVPILQSKIWI